MIPAGQANAPYQIHGVTKNQTYLVIARADGYVNQKIDAVVAAADKLDANFPALSTGGTLTGTVTIAGDTGRLDPDLNNLFDTDINVFSPSTYAGSSRHIANVPTSATSTSFTYSISGLDDGDYYLYLNLPGFEANPAGQITATVSHAAGTKDIQFLEYSGVLQVTVIAPGGTNYSSDVSIDVQSLNSQNTATQPVGTWSGNTYTISKLGTDIYTVRAQLKADHFVREQTIRVSNGGTSAVTLDVTGSTYKITGAVTTNASSPYNTLSQLVSATTPQVTLDLSTLQNVSLPANRIVARRFNQYTYYQPAAGVPSIDPRSEYYGTYGADGKYEIDGLSPGVYIVFNNDELDGRADDGPEIAKTQNTVYVSQDTSQDFVLTSGINVDGTIQVNGDPETAGRQLQIALEDKNNNQLNSTNLVFLGTQMNFPTLKTFRRAIIFSSSAIFRRRSNTSRSRSASKRGTKTSRAWRSRSPPPATSKANCAWRRQGNFSARTIINNFYRTAFTFRRRRTPGSRAARTRRTLRSSTRTACSRSPSIRAITISICKTTTRSIPPPSWRRDEKCSCRSPSPACKSPPGRRRIWA